MLLFIAKHGLVDFRSLVFCMFLHIDTLSTSCSLNLVQTTVSMLWRTKNLIGSYSPWLPARSIVFQTLVWRPHLDITLVVA